MSLALQDMKSLSVLALAQDKLGLDCWGTWKSDWREDEAQMFHPSPEILEELQHFLNQSPGAHRKIQTS